VKAKVVLLSEENKAFIRRVNDEIFNQGNLDLVYQVFSIDYVLHDIEKERWSPEHIKNFASGLRAAFPDLHVIVEPLISEGDKVAWVRTHSGTHQGDFLGIPATGKKVSWKSCNISRIVDGKIVEEWHSTNLQDQLT